MNTQQNPTIATRIESIKSRLAIAAKRFDRTENEIKLIAVSKFHPIETIHGALLTGHRTFGENRVQEANDKWPTLKERFSDIELHLIGPLQTNKAKLALSLFDVIETIDRKKLVDAIVKELPHTPSAPKFYIQVNIGEEEQKAGVSINELEGLLLYCKEQKLTIDGLMCIPPSDKPAAPYFALLRKYANKHHIKELSMGMSGDFEEAIQQGATSIRVGTAIFGERENL